MTGYVLYNCIHTISTRFKCTVTVTPRGPVAALLISQCTVALTLHVASADCVYLTM